MHINTAIALRDNLDKAINEAIDNGSDMVDIVAQASAMDDAARDELDRAIKEAEQGAK